MTAENVEAFPYFLLFAQHFPSNNKDTQKQSEINFYLTIWGGFSMICKKSK